MRSVGNHPGLPLNEPETDFTNPDVKRKLREALDSVKSKCEDVPIVIGGQEFRTDNVQYQVSVSMYLVFDVIYIGLSDNLQNGYPNIILYW